MGSAGGLDISGNAVVEKMSENIPAAGVAGTGWAIFGGTGSFSSPVGFVPERRQQIGATVLRAVRKHNSVFEPSSKKCEIAELWLQAVAMKASLHLKQQELLERLSVCLAANHRRQAEERVE